MTSQHAQTQTEKTDDANLPAGTATTQAEAADAAKPIESLPAFKLYVDLTHNSLTTSGGNAQNDADKEDLPLVQASVTPSFEPMRHTLSVAYAGVPAEYKSPAQILNDTDLMQMLPTTYLTNLYYPGCQLAHLQNVSLDPLGFNAWLSKNPLIRGYFYEFANDYAALDLFAPPDPESLARVLVPINTRWGVGLAIGASDYNNSIHGGLYYYCRLLTLRHVLRHALSKVELLKVAYRQSYWHEEDALRNHAEAWFGSIRAFCRRRWYYQYRHHAYNRVAMALMCADNENKMENMLSTNPLASHELIKDDLTSFAVLETAINDETTRLDDEIHHLEEAAADRYMARTA